MFFQAFKVESAFPCFALFPHTNLFHSLFVMQMPKLGDGGEGEL